MLCVEDKNLDGQCLSETKYDTGPSRDFHMNLLFCHSMHLCRVSLFNKALGMMLALMISRAFCRSFVDDLNALFLSRPRQRSLVRAATKERCKA